MVKVLILLKRLQSNRAVDLLQVTEQRSHKLHATNPAQQLGSRLDHTLITSLHTNLQIQIGHLDVRALSQPVHLAHQLRQLGSERLLPQQDLFQEDQDLVCGQTLEIAGVGLEGGVGQSLPFLGEVVDNVDHGGVEDWLGGQTRRVEPFVPVQLVQELGGLGVGLEEVQDGCFELVGVEGLALEGGEVLKRKLGI